VRTDALGRFRTSGLVAGDWRAWIQHTDHEGELWDDVACPATCNLHDGAAIPLAPNSLASLSVELTPSSFFEVDVDVEGAPPELPAVLVYDEFGSQVWVESRPVTGEPGRVRVGPLLPGSYRAVAFSPEAFKQVLGGAVCVDDCSAELMGGTVYSFPAQLGATLQASLVRRPTLHGTLTDAISAAPLANVRAVLYHTDGSPSREAFTDASGRYSFGPITVAGPYYLKFEAPKHLDEVHADIACEDMFVLGCSAQATEFNFGLGTTSRVVDATLRRSGAISGQIVQRAVDLGWPLEGAWIAKSDAGALVFQQSVYVDDEHRYTLDDLREGSSRFRVGAGGYFQQAYDGIDCLDQVQSPPADCPWSIGVLVNSTSGVVTEGINFRLMRRNARMIRVVADETGMPLPSVMLDQWRTDGSWIRAATTDASGRAFVDGAAAPGVGSATPIYLSTDSGGGYIDEVFDNRTCPTGGSVYQGTCLLLPATVLLIPGDGAILPEVEIRLHSAPEGVIFGSGFE
jgi:hypothetical protein